jgi:hypothetical protein
MGYVILRMAAAGTAEKPTVAAAMARILKRTLPFEILHLNRIDNMMKSVRIE